MVYNHWVHVGRRMEFERSMGRPMGSHGIGTYSSEPSASYGMSMGCQYLYRSHNPMTRRMALWLFYRSRHRMGRPLGDPHDVPCDTA